MQQVFGNITVSVSVPATVGHELACVDGVERHAFTFAWHGADAAGKKPTCTLSFALPLVDIQYMWHSGCGSDRRIGPDWGRGAVSKISSGCPLTCLYNDAGRNRLTVALSDCVTPIERNLGVREEGALLACRVEIPLDDTGLTERYAVTLWVDRTDRRYEQAIRAVTDWWEEMYPPMPVPRNARLPMYSFWYSFHQQLYMDQVEAECARAAQMGMRTVIVDDGWQTDDNSRGYAYCGDWQPASVKIPDMKGHVARVHAMGLKYMLWYSVPFVGRYSGAAARFEGKTLYYIDRLKTYVLDPRYPEVRAYLVGIYEQALRAWDLDGFKLDFIDSFRMAPETPGFKEGMDYVALEEAVHRLMVDVMRALRALKPDILIEFRQSYMGPVMREFGNMIRVGDCPATTITNRVGMVDLRLTSGRTAVHSDMLVWNEGDRVENAVCQIENVLFSVAQISVRLSQVPEEHAKAIRFWVRFMEQEQALLLDAPLTAECPQMLYPEVRAEKDGRAVIACYQRERVIRLDPRSLREGYVVNACSGDRLVLDLACDGAYRAAVMNCMGEPVAEQTVRGPGLVSLPVPECGLVHLTKL